MPTGINYLNALPGYKGETWNPVTGCTPCSPGCDNCWAQSMLRRYKQPTAVTCHPDRLDKPLHWRDPRFIGTCYMGDWCHPDVPGLFVADILEVVRRCPQHIFLVLTKRAGRMAMFMKNWTGPKRVSEWAGRDLQVLRNLWLGVSVCTQKEADEKVEILRGTPAAKRVVSAEPQLERIDWALTELDGIDWLIKGCESGPGARGFDLWWAKHARATCESSHVAYYLKQIPDPKRKGGVIHTPGLDGDPCTEVPDA